MQRPFLLYPVLPVLVLALGGVATTTQAGQLVREFSGERSTRTAD